ncbi:hypothetical protein [Streptomyces xiamenensis]|uniref:hypothetical protein n=1 Tax=Streptomyces xiamenensis TaxID=408015 RepID=UPI003D74698D
MVSGNGSPLNPYVVGIQHGGEEGCDAITACVGDNLGPGLGYDAGTGRIQARLEPGGGMTFGPSGGLATTGGGGGGGDSCNRSIGQLPPAPDVVGADRLAGLVNPFNSPFGVDYCITHQVDIVGALLCATADGTAWVADTEAGDVSDARTSLYVSQHASILASDTIASATSYAGDPDDPYMAEGMSRGDRRGGWYGWLAPNYQHMMVTDLLERIGGRAVAMLHCHAVTAANVPDETAAATVQAAIRAVLQHCAQDWAIIATRRLVDVSTVQNSGLVAALASPQPAQWGETTLPWPVADVTAAGVQWMLLDRYYADEVFEAYRDAGVQVLMWGATRHVHRQRVADLGIRGGYGGDPVYYRGPDVHDYRMTWDPWTHRRFGVGQLTHATDRRSVIGPQVRGYTQGVPPTSPQPENVQGLVLPPNFGRQHGSPAALAGWYCPVWDPQEYRIEVEAKFLEINRVRRNKLSILFGAVTDEEPYQWPADDPAVNPEGFSAVSLNCYRAWQRATGDIGIGIWVDGEFSTLAEIATPEPAVGAWSSYELLVTPSSIRWRRTAANGQTYTVTAADTTHRGGYFWIEKEESLPGSAAVPFRGKFRNLHYRPGLT